MSYTWRDSARILAFAAILMFFIDVWLQVELSEAFVEGPLGMVFIATPGSVIFYLALLYVFIQYIRQGNSMGQKHEWANER